MQIELVTPPAIPQPRNAFAQQSISDHSPYSLSSQVQWQQPSYLHMPSVHPEMSEARNYSSHSDYVSLQFPDSDDLA